MLLKISNVRLAFPALFEPKAFGDDGKLNYGGSMILESAQKCKAQIGVPNPAGGITWEPAGPAEAIINTAIDRVATEKWKAQAGAVLKQLRATDKVALHDGDLKAQYAGFAGNKFVATNSTARPVVVDKDRTPLTAADGKPYGGCYCNVTVDLWAQDNKFGKRVNATLTGVQFVKDGEAFGGGRRGTADDFDDLGEGAGDLF